jgi:hypothetical protein
MNALFTLIYDRTANRDIRLTSVNILVLGGFLDFVYEISEDRRLPEKLRENALRSIQTAVLGTAWNQALAHKRLSIETARSLIRHFIHSNAALAAVELCFTDVDQQLAEFIVDELADHHAYYALERLVRAPNDWIRYLAMRKVQERGHP